MGKIITINEASEIFASDKIVLVTGSFDILHLGHLSFLHEAKTSTPQDTKLMVIILPDKEVKRRKGENRPVFSQKVRLEALSYIRNVDFVVGWEGSWESLRDFVIENKPRYMAVTKEDPGYENKVKAIMSFGGEVIEVEKFDNISTSLIIERLSK